MLWFNTDIFVLDEFKTNGIRRGDIKRATPLTVTKSAITTALPLLILIFGFILASS